ncbi:serine/threonine-protein phosphatase, partial [Streptomyces sp. NPDC005349]
MIAGRFYPLETRVARWNTSGPEALLHDIHGDLPARTRGGLNGAVLVACIATRTTMVTAVMEPSSTQAGSH